MLYNINGIYLFNKSETRNDMTDNERKELNILSDTDPEALMMLKDQMRSFRELMTYYRCAMMEAETKFRVLNEEFSLEYDRNPIETIKTRLKSPESIFKKLRNNGNNITVKSIEENLADVAGIRVICSFPRDIYMLADCLLKQDDIVLVKMKDYIRNPKPNGYRSLHLIVEIPIFLKDKKKLMKVEIQFRTIAMDFWASIEHKLKYKKHVPDAERLTEELKDCADTIAQLDMDMQNIRMEIESDIANGD